MKKILKMLFLGILVSIAEASGVENLKIECDTGNAQSCLHLGMTYMESPKTSKNKQKGIALVKKSCEMGEMSSCHILGLYYYENRNGEVKQNLSKAKSFFQKACDNSFHESCFELGHMYEYGIGVNKNYSKSLELYIKACSGGDSTACMNAGVLYEQGQGVKQDFFIAKEMYRTACNSGKIKACSFIGDMYVRGMGVEQDYVKARNIYEITCEQNDAIGCFGLATMYIKNQGMKTDYRKVKKLLLKSCNGNLKEACELYYNIILKEEETSSTEHAKAADKAKYVGLEEMEWFPSDYVGKDLKIPCTNLRAREESEDNLYSFTGRCLINTNGDRTEIINPFKIEFQSNKKVARAIYAESKVSSRVMLVGTIKKNTKKYGFAKYIFQINGVEH